MKPTVGALCFTTVLLLLAGTGCVENGPVTTEEMQNEPVSIPLGSANRADVHLDLAAGELELRGGAATLIQGSLGYNAVAWKPIVDTSSGDGRITVRIKEPEGIHFGPHMHYRWDLELNDTALFNLEVNCGAGKARLELGNLNLDNVKVNMGAGEVDVDLRGKPAHDYDVHISGGVGKATVWLPRDVGVRADAHGGIGSINVVGLEKNGEHYENSLYDHSGVNVHVSVDGGIGQIQLIG